MNIGKESENLEFKKSLAELDVGIKSLTAMLNRNNKGEVCYGVDDNGDVLGLTIGTKTLIDVKERIKILVNPAILPKVIDVKTDDGKAYIRVTAEGTSIPYSCDGRYFIRNCASYDKIDQEVLIQMVESNSDDRIREIRALSQSLTFNYLKASFANHNIHIANDDAMCDSYHLKTKQNEYNMTAFLLSDNNTIPIRVIRFAGKDKVHMLDKKEYLNQSLLKSLQNVIDYLDLYNTSKVDLSSAERKETPLFDKDSLREAVINAFIHNDWKNETPPTIFIYDNRIEVLSYGELPYKLSKEKFFNGQSIPINRGLFTVFMANQIAEQSGHGVPTIVAKYGKESFDFSAGTVLVTIKFAFLFRSIEINDSFGFNEQILNKEKRNATKETTKETTKEKLKGNMKDVYDAICSNNSITIKEIAEKIPNITMDGVQYNVNRLKNLGFIKHAGATKGGYWLILK